VSPTKRTPGALSLDILCDAPFKQADCVEPVVAGCVSGQMFTFGKRGQAD
jgi:hypothetical protein